ncbi:RELT-like protein 2 [Hippoglossus hippoglossus]|uniref:RELT-like protein 2 n=1 Tax=Hippoglossus hippoglossus TaxID=8267 RepID=UPI00148D79F0|nr:RELT-like protein 2 [Hippoglossus hippoglossus]XP_034454647.1 RELT-like protein 2 [Hippoglossus hippoglossus]XP_034454648.1 RELT-like protein 2 [Hippoglossus hippoglossus]XP_034454649.1 RELT-like protein 2 [Hippoglossus hippoglossus]XP_034454650.1 RELT-like protein 2 [Hippoglossus hippoglossus]
MTDSEASSVGENPPPYMIFVVVFLFFLTGLLGFLICHLLKKKGYRCRTGDMDDEDEDEKVGGNTDEEDEENQDTVEQILKCIIENEANMEAFNEMLGNHNVCVRHDPRLRKESIGGVPPHHHTVHSGTDHNSCHLCAQVQSKKGRRQSRTPRYRQRPGEQTVFSVGRFRVTHTDKKLHGGPNPLVSSGDQLDQSQDSEEQKEGGYNLRSMFKDVGTSSEGANGVVPNVGKRRKSVTIFGLRRGSETVGIKEVEGTGREAGGVKFAIQKQPVVLEELVQAQNIEIASECGTKCGSTPGTEPSQNEMPAPLQREVETSGSVNSPSFPSKKQPHDFSSAPEPRMNLIIKPSVGSMANSALSSFLISSPTMPGHTYTATEKQGHAGDKIMKNEQDYDPGPLQTSTPTIPMAGFIPGFTPVIPAGQSESCLSTVFPVIQTPPDPSSSPDLEHGFGASLAFISLGSSPQSSFPIKFPSSTSLLKTPTSPQTVMSSPALSSRNKPPETTKTARSPALTPSPKLPSGQAMSSQSNIASSLEAQTPSPALSSSPKLTTFPVSSQQHNITTLSSSPADQNPGFRSSTPLQSESVMSVKSMTTGDMVSNPLPIKEEEQARIPNTEEKTEKKMVGILKTAERSPVEGGVKGLALSFPSDPVHKDRLSSLQPSPSSPLSTAASGGSRISSRTIIKASPDSKREFSVVTMMEDEESTSLTKDQKRETCKEKEDMVEMEDIKDCKVMQLQEAERAREEVEKTVDTQLT